VVVVRSVVNGVVVAAVLVTGVVVVGAVVVSAVVVRVLDVVAVVTGLIVSATTKTFLFIYILLSVYKRSGLRLYPQRI